MNSKKEIFIQKLVSNARAIISYQIGLPVGCLKMSRIITWIRDYEIVEYPIFDEYLKEVQGLPLGTERLRWNQESLRRYDQKLVPINLKYRDAIIDTCFEIIKIYDQQSRD